MLGDYAPGSRLEFHSGLDLKVPQHGGLKPYGHTRKGDEAIQQLQIIKSTIL